MHSSFSIVNNKEVFPEDSFPMIAIVSFFENSNVKSLTAVSNSPYFS